MGFTELLTKQYLSVVEFIQGSDFILFLSYRGYKSRYQKSYKL